MTTRRTAFAAWKVADIEDDIKKAANHLLADPNALVRFYSRADFGDLARLVDRARQMRDLAAFLMDMPMDLQPERTKLETVWKDALANSTHNIHDLLLRISFHPTPSPSASPSSAEGKR